VDQVIGNVYESALLQDFPWPTNRGTIFVDCGGGLGNLALALSRMLPCCTFVVQDLPEVVEIAKENFMLQNPVACNAGLLRAEIHDFFDPQTVKADVYILRFIMHNWPDNECVRETDGNT